MKVIEKDCIFQLVIIPAQGEMETRVGSTSKMSSVIFTSLVERHVRSWAEDSHDEEEIEEILAEVWNSHEVKDGVHMVRTETETIIMVVLN